jgi:hypothetical protein
VAGDGGSSGAAGASAERTDAPRFLGLLAEKVVTSERQGGAMKKTSFETDIDGTVADNLVSVARTSLGDTLRSVVYFTPSAFDILYTRTDLYDSAERLTEAKSRLVEFERTGFAEGPVRTAIARGEGGSDIGRYEFTVRFHEDGFVVRVIEGDAGVLFTADSMDVTAFDDAATAIGGLLAE